MNKREAEEQLMNSDSSSGGGEPPKQHSSNGGSGGGSPNKRNRQQQQRNKHQKPVQLETTSVALDMENTNGAGDRNSSSNLKKLSGDLEKMTSAQSTDSLSSSSSCSKAIKCLIILSMSLMTILLAAIILAIFKFNLLDNEDQCLIANQPFQDNSYKLFATKTTYKIAYETIDKLLESNNAPKIFSKDNLKSINDKLTSAQNNCKVVQLHYYGRHAARFPDDEDIKEYNQVIRNIQNRIDLSKFSLPAQPVSSDKPALELSNDFVTIVSSNNSTSEHRECSNPMTQYKQWQPFMDPSQDNLISDSGFEETEAIAARLKKIYPDMFNASFSNISISTSSAIRTSQTAIPFMRQLVNYKFTDDCPTADSFPTANLSLKESVNLIKENKCLQSLNETKLSRRLEFHKQCDELSVEGDDTEVGPNLTTNAFTTIAESISKSLKLPISDQLSPKEIKALYSVCKYETAILGSSIWCNLFTEKNLKFYEYYNDVETWHKHLYGDSDQIFPTCVVLEDLINQFLQVINSPRNSLIPHTYLHFTHSEVIRKMIASIVDLSDDKSYKKKSVEGHLRAGSIPEKREWKSSLFTPFSANLLFTLYECGNNPPSSGGLREVSVNGAPFRLVVSLNEHPILVDDDHCPDTVCPMSKMDKLRLYHTGTKKCDLVKLCAKKYKLRGVE